MLICRKCKTKFKYIVWIDGKPRHLQRRKYCLTCSPFGSHNTRKDIDAPRTSRPRTYAEYPLEMRRKHAKECYERGKRLRRKLLARAGGKCQKCGYKKCEKALQFHHKNRRTKCFSLSISDIRARTWESVLREADKCVLLCSNCHIEVEHELSISPLANIHDGRDSSVVEHGVFQGSEVGGAIPSPCANLISHSQSAPRPGPASDWAVREVSDCVAASVTH